MRILTISSLYPPEYVGGYELACADIMGRLHSRGHEVHVLTSKRRRKPLDLPRDDAWTHRAFDFAPLAASQAAPILARLRCEWSNNRACRYWLAALRPDVISVWDFWGLLPSLLTTLRRAGVPLTYAISSHWVLEYTSVEHRWSAFWDVARSHGPKRVLKQTLMRITGSWIDHAMPFAPPQLDLRPAFFSSCALREQYAAAGWPCADAPVIHHGVDVTLFSPRGWRSSGSSTRRLLVAGRVVREKGIHVAIEALALLRRDDRGLAPTLDIVGPQIDPAYAESLRRSVAQYGLEHVVSFHSQVPRETMPEVYRSHDILVLPSVYEEPFALTVLEAMACGLPVVGTATGGSKEVLEHGETGLVFRADDPRSLAEEVGRLLANPNLARTLADNALHRVRQDFTIEQAAARVEQFLLDEWVHFTFGATRYDC